MRRIVLTLPSNSTAVANTVSPNGSTNGSTKGSRPPSGVNGLLQGDVIFDRKFDVYPTKGWDVWTKSRNANHIDMEPSRSKQQRQQQQQQPQPQQQQQGGNNGPITASASPRGSSFAMPTMPSMFSGKPQQQVHPHLPYTYKPINVLSDAPSHVRFINSY